MSASTMNGHTVKSRFSPALQSNDYHYTDDKNNDPTTDRSRWRLLDERGRQTWMYLNTKEESKAWPQSIADKYHLGLQVVSIPY